MIRVLHVISGLGSGGTEGVLYRLLAAGKHEEFAHSVVSLSDEGVWGEKIRQLGVPVQVIRMPKGLPTPGFLSRLKTQVSGGRPDLVMGWLYRGNLAATWAARWAHAPLVWNVRHSLHDWKRERFLFKLSVRANRWLSKRPELVVYNSRTAQAQHEAFGFRSRQSQVIPNGFDTARFCPNPQARERWRHTWGAEDGALIVGLSARYHPTKNHRGFVAAAAQVLKAFPGVLFVLVGDGTGPENLELAEAVRATGYADRFRLMGRVDDVQEVVSGWDLAVNASFGEAFPNAVAEALACGVPCLATNVGDSAWIVGEAGGTVEPDGLAAGILRLLESGGEQLKRLGTLGRARVERDFPLVKMVESYEEIYARSKFWKTSKLP
jgi:glycosyltransferase involved in cell wall biosynthesis